MIMNARRNQDVVICQLEGYLDFETTSHLKETCAMLMKQNNTHRIIFNMEKLKFVGSSGINQFIKVLKHLNAQKEKLKLCNLSSEFQKLFKAFETSRKPFQIYDDEGKALASFALPAVPQKSAKRKTTTQ